VSETQAIGEQLDADDQQHAVTDSKESLLAHRAVQAHTQPHAKNGQRQQHGRGQQCGLGEEPHGGIGHDLDVVQNGEKADRGGDVNRFVGLEAQQENLHGRPPAWATKLVKPDMAPATGPIQGRMTGEKRPSSVRLQ